MLKIHFLALMILLFGAGTLVAKEIVVMNYNTEHLMDYEDNPTTMDDEYTPFGYLNWDEAKFKEKVKNLTRAIMDNTITGYFGMGPDIIVLEEIENRFTLEVLMDSLNSYLAAHQPLAKRYNEIVHFETDDYIGIETGIITRIPVVSSRTHVVHQNDQTWYYKKASDYYDKEIYSTVRDILEARFRLRGKEFIILGNHWPAKKRGGTEFDAVKRFMTAQFARNIIKARLQSEPKIDIILTGDFNSEPEEVALTNGLHAVDNINEVKASPNTDPLLYNLNYQFFNYYLLKKEFMNAKDRFLSVYTTTGKWDGSVFRELLPRMTDKRKAQLAIREYITTYEGRLVKAALTRLKNALFNNLTKKRGTFWFAKYKQWKTLDSFILNANLFDRTNIRYIRNSYKIISSDFLNDEQGYPYGYSKCFWDKKANTCIKNEDGTIKIRKGYSDHYPIIARFKVY